MSTPKPVDETPQPEIRGGNRPSDYIEEYSPEPPWNQPEAFEGDDEVDDDAS
jgi:hypothetical protein